MEQTASAENTPKPESPLKKQRGTNRKEHPMKELNRREFLTLSGAAIVALSLAGCGGGSSAPAAPTTSEEAKVLEAIKKYRAAAGVKEQITLEDGLKPAAEIVAEVVKGKRKYEESIEDLSKIMSRYKDVSAPIGIAVDIDSGNMMPVCVYSEDAEQMAQKLPLQVVDDGAKENLKSASLIAIQVFEYGGVKYWVAIVAKGKVTP